MAVHYLVEVVADTVGAVPRLRTMPADGDDLPALAGSSAGSSRPVRVTWPRFLCPEVALQNYDSLTQWIDRLHGGGLTDE
jgi:hypothetical protein